MQINGFSSIAPDSAGTAAATPAPNHGRLREAAQQFEAMMLGELLKPLGQHSSFETGEEKTDPGPLESFGTEAVAGALARSGALGFAARLVRSVGQRAGGSGSTPKDLSSLSVPGR